MTPCKKHYYNGNNWCAMCGHIKGQRPSRSAVARFMRGESVYAINCSTEMNTDQIENKIRRHMVGKGGAK